MKRGDIVTIAAQGDDGKPRPAVVVQSDLFTDTHATILVCPLTSALSDAPVFRISVKPSPENGLRVASQIMADKIVTMRREKIGDRVGSLDDATLARLNRSLALFIGVV